MRYAKFRKVLRTVLECRDRLLQIWEDASASHGRALEQLRELCAQAEGSSILALRKFALSLPTYAPAPASSSTRYKPIAI